MGYKKIDVSESAESIKDAWSPITLGDVEDCLVKLVVFEGAYAKHKHVRHDEFIFVADGKICVEFEDATVELETDEGIFIEKGTVHRSKCEGRATVLLFEKRTIADDIVHVL